MTDEQLNALVERLAELERTLESACAPDEAPSPLAYDVFCAASAIRQLMRERDEAHRAGQRDMQLRALAVTNNAGIFARIMELEITRQPPF